jgi:uncharacterized RDD family membrane protein YckC/ribosomal protein S27AE
MNRNSDGLVRNSSQGAASQTNGSHSLADTISRKSADKSNFDPKKGRTTGSIDLSRKTTQDQPAVRSFNDDIKAKIAALEQAENKTKLICPGCGATSLESRLTCGACGRYFERGVEETIWDKALNPLVGKDRQLLSAAQQERAARVSYAGRRLAAKAVDISIVASLLWLEAIGYFGLIRAVMGVPGAAALLINFYYIVVSLVWLVTVLGYQAVFESSPVQATLGKLLFGLYVSDKEGQTVRCEQIVFKTIISLLPILAFAAVYGHFWQARLCHGLSLDAATTAVVAVSALAALLTYIAMHIMLGAEKRRQTVPDLLVGVMVIER